MSVSNWSESVGTSAPQLSAAVVLARQSSAGLGAGVPLGELQAVIKRALDIVLSAVALAFFLPLFLVVALAIKLESRGPALFSQQRWGRGCAKIKVYKFRSMRADMEDRSGVTQTVENDVRVTRIGGFLRRANIDELPQLWNVLVGDMSLVGPRCHPVGMKAGGLPYEELVSGYHARHAVRPGLTGLAQVRGHRGPTTSVAKARMRIVSDIHYVENFSLMLDAKILYRTLVNELRGGSGF